MAPPSWIGHTLNGRYQITELLGQGGMSAVYKADDPNLRRAVAVKLIHSHLSDDSEFVRRFEEEATAVAQLRHPHIVQVFDFNHDDNTYYIVFEYVPGETLSDRLKRFHESSRAMPFVDVLRIALQVAKALGYAHQRNLVHRDVKPANVLLNVQSEAILTDFGIVKITGGTQHTATGAVLGTAQYMSPEQIRGTSIDARSDLYSLGVMLFEMVGGRPPFSADSAMTLMMMHMTDPVPDLRNIRPETPPRLIDIIEKALAKEPDERYQSAADLIIDLQHIQEGKTAKAPSISTKKAGSVASPKAASSSSAASAPQSQSPRSNRNLMIGGGILGGIVLLVLFLWLGGVFNSGNSGGEETAENLAVTTPEDAGQAEAAVPIGETPHTPTATDSPTATGQPTNTATSTSQPTVTTPPTDTPNPLEPPSDPSLGSTWIRPQDDMTMVYVPSGSFLMGSNPELDSFADADEQPQREVTVDGFWIDQTEVTNAQFAQFVEATNYVTQAELDGSGWVHLGADFLVVEGANWRHPGGPDTDFEELLNYPVVQMAWNDATAYCEWAGAQLPGETQWEYAAISPESLLFPWGNAFDGNVINFCDINCVLPQSNANFDDGYTQLAPVGSYPDGASWVGALDMIGNVWEWTSDLYLPYPGNTDDSDSYDNEMYVLRGGSWVDGARNSRPANRAINPANRYELLGFRCVRLSS